MTLSEIHSLKQTPQTITTQNINDHYIYFTLLPLHYFAQNLTHFAFLMSSTYKWLRDLMRRDTASRRTAPTSSYSRVIHILLLVNTTEAQFITLYCTISANTDFD